MTKQQLVTELFKFYFESNGYEPNSSFPRAASASGSTTTTRAAPEGPPQRKAVAKTDEDKNATPKVSLVKHADVEKEKAALPIGAASKTKHALPVKDHAPPHPATSARSSKGTKRRG